MVSRMRGRIELQELYRQPVAWSTTTYHAMSPLWWDHNSIIVLASLTHLELHIHCLGTVARLSPFTKRAYMHKTA
jgi:hypothetical protein